jgi:hypothetical protein
MCDAGEARRSIDQQGERVQQVRERAVGLVGSGSIIAAALGLAPQGSGHATRGRSPRWTRVAISEVH